MNHEERRDWMAGRLESLIRELRQSKTPVDIEARVWTIKQIVDRSLDVFQEHNAKSKVTGSK